MEVHYFYCSVQISQKISMAVARGCSSHTGSVSKRRAHFSPGAIVANTMTTIANFYPDSISTRAFCDKFQDYADPNALFPLHVGNTDAIQAKKF